VGDGYFGVDELSFTRLRCMNKVLNYDVGVSGLGMRFDESVSRCIV
jgi:hypothetical protein